MNDEPEIPADRIRAAYPTPSPADIDRAWQRVVATTPSRLVVPWVRTALAAALLLGTGFGAGWQAGRRAAPPPPVVTLSDGTSIPIRAPELVTASSISEGT